MRLGLTTFVALAFAPLAITASSPAAAWTGSTGLIERSPDSLTTVDQHLDKRGPMRRDGNRARPSSWPYSPTRRMSFRTVWGQTYYVYFDTYQGPLPIGYGNGDRGGEAEARATRAPENCACRITELWHGRRCSSEVDGGSLLKYEDSCSPPRRYWYSRMRWTYAGRCPDDHICEIEDQPDQHGRYLTKCVRDPGDRRKTDKLLQRDMERLGQISLGDGAGSSSSSTTRRARGGLDPESVNAVLSQRSIEEQVPMDRDLEACTVTATIVKSSTTANGGTEMHFDPSANIDLYAMVRRGETVVPLCDWVWNAADDIPPPPPVTQLDGSTAVRNYQRSSSRSCYPIQQVDLKRGDKIDFFGSIKRGIGYILIFSILSHARSPSRIGTALP